METLKNIKLDIDRIILQLIIPGAFTVVPFFLLFINSNIEAKEYFIKSEGVEDLLKDEEAKFIIDSTIIPEFKNGDYFNGIKNGLLEIIKEIE